ncbi:hypothetical protein C6I20_07260 [Aeromicrobium sp. A1-2]|uniref:DUF3179 domain-containing protein n=1 Tax=Aeromicrobium sp. A1-2 TaxID=2107713 RepID=UPI000E4B5D87|nr:DUF3179 domain-containing protein [Aeromicrobium sp. A1-2]AXT86811.1 hypothetical protein C6I20_07260 [Aeromicrobium sp. A1-2]
MARHRLPLLLTTVFLTLVTACSSADTDAADREDVPSALKDPTNAAFPTALIDVAELKSGGPAPDGIPPIDEPKFESAADVDWLEDEEPVLSLTVGGETRAYPLRVMTWHEIVNDEVGGEPVAVTYCPLCNSGVAFLRTVPDRGVLSFGTSGMLFADNLVMYDRQTESLWPQLTGQASVGVLTGTQLEAIPMGTVAWGDFVAAAPAAKVLSRDTGFDRPYGTNPYAGYDDPSGELLFGLPGEVDTRLPVKERVIGISDDAAHVAVLRSSLVGEAPLEVTVGEREVVLWHLPGQTSALDADTIAGGDEIGTVGVFSPVLDGQELHFKAGSDGFVDRETGSEWNILGRATAGKLKGSVLDAVRHLDTFWFAWVVFHPETSLIGSSAR